MSVTVYGAKPYMEALKGLVRDIRVTWTLEELGLPYELVVLDIAKGENKTEAYLKLNPMGKVPTLVDNGFVLSESAAICEYLAHGNGRLMPESSSPDYFHFKQWSYFALTNLEPQGARLVSADFFMEPGEVASGVKKLVFDVLPRFLAPLNERLKDREYIMSEFSLADIFTGSTLLYVTHTPILNDYPALQKYVERIKQRPAFIKARATHG